MPALPHPAPGFTLVEAATALCVVAVLAALAWPALDTLLDNRRLDALSSTLGADLQFARSEAIVRNEGVRFTVLPHRGDGTCWLVHTGPATDCSCEAGCAGGARLLRRAHVPSAQRVQLRAPAVSLHFDPQLGTCTPAGTFELAASSGRAVHQVVNVMGRVRSCSPLAQVPGHVAC